MNVHVNENCIGCGLCVNMCGSVFLMTEEGVAAAQDEIFPEQEGQVQEAAESCPVNAQRGWEEPGEESAERPLTGWREEE